VQCVGLGDLRSDFPTGRSPWAFVGGGVVEGGGGEEGEGRAEMNRVPILFPFPGHFSGIVCPFIDP